MIRILFLTFIFMLAVSSAFAATPKIINYNDKEKTLKVEIDGKEYTLFVPIEEAQVMPEEIIVEEANDTTLDGKVSKKKRKRYALGPTTTRIGSRIYNIPNDNLLRKKGFGYDFTHRFSSPIAETTANDLYGLDTFAYTGLGLYYGITDYLEAHVFRSSLTDAVEVGTKIRLLRESRKFGEGSPVGFTLATGFQNDNIQDDIDFYVQGILSKVIIPKWMKLYLAPTWADQTATIGSASSLSASFFTFLDPKGRKFSKGQSTFALPIGLVIQIVPDKLSLFGEYTPVLAGYKEVENGWAFGLQFASRLETHLWSVGISNVPYTTFGQSIVGGPSNDFFIGFNITARIK